MNLSMLLDIVAAGCGDRVLLGDVESGLTGAELDRRATLGAHVLLDAGVDTVAYLADNGPDFAVTLFAAARAGIPFLPMNFRLASEQIDEIVSRRARPLVIGNGHRPSHGSFMSIEDWSAATAVAAEPPTRALPFAAFDEPAVLLMTSGTTAAPKTAVLRHENLTSYIINTVEFASAPPDSSILVSVPPYHIAAVANVLSNLYAGRRLVYLTKFDAGAWIDIARAQAVTNAMVVPTMLARIVDELTTRGENGPDTLRTLSYGGAKVSPTVLANALELFPETGFVNGYGLTETASSIAVLGPDDHRTAQRSDVPEVRARLASVGKPLPEVTIEVHDPDGRPCPPGVEGDIVVRGGQIAGAYAEKGSLVDADGWFHTRDLGHFDADGYLFVHGRADDTIIRGGENIAPAEIEDVLVGHPEVHECAVAGVPDDEWGHRIAAFVVLTPGATTGASDLRQWVRDRLRGSKTPSDVVFVEELPTTATGKLLRRELVKLVATPAS
ncbi:AMP-binding protein [uncultured Williamsia sp.]|uniref:class I adenylate-forming enzyme family protein n=1 Tax=uncultured Williamsia sp. TaxID=259311 RepID=UPI0026269B33|nr:AMP-binding protein [uncultured Williamsia sp.]